MYRLSNETSEQMIERHREDLKDSKELLESLLTDHPVGKKRMHLIKSLISIAGKLLENDAFLERKADERMFFKHLLTVMGEIRRIDKNE